MYLTSRELEIWEGRSGLSSETEEQYREYFRKNRDDTKLPPNPSVCIHLGPIVEYAPCNCEAKHVHTCTHPDAEYDRCTRGKVRGSPYPSCAECGGNPTGLKESE